MSIMLTTASTAPAKDRPTFTLQLRPEPGVDPVHALRSALKRLLRQLWRKKTAALFQRRDRGGCRAGRRRRR
jgi:hypothetical protein